MGVFKKMEAVDELNKTTIQIDRSIENESAILEEREEGEIVDDCEIILSSQDEEYSVGNCVKQLEANKDLEKFERISRNFTAQIHAKRKKKYRMKRNKMCKYEKKCSRLCDRSRAYHHCNAKRQKHGFKSSSNSYYDSKLETVLIDSYDSLSDNEIDDGSLSYSISREKLRFALARNINTETNSGNLRKCLTNKNDELKSNNHITSIRRSNKYLTNDSSKNEKKFQECLNNTSTDDTLEECQLRLIALKSAVLKKHYKRQKRDAEIAYSPTDFVDINSYGNCAGTNIDDIQDLTDISPADSPSHSISPIEGMTVDTKPVDMDIALSDNDDHALSRTEFVWPTHNTLHINNHEEQDFNKVLQIHSAEEKSKPNHTSQILPVLVDYDFGPCVVPKQQTEKIEFSELSNYKNECRKSEVQSKFMRISNNEQIICNNLKNIGESSDEEATALRDLLLSKLKRPIKHTSDHISHEIVEDQTKCSKTIDHNDFKSSKLSIEKPKQPDFDAHDDTEKLRVLLLSSMSKTAMDSKTTPVILNNMNQSFEFKRNDQERIETQNSLIKAASPKNCKEQLPKSQVDIKPTNNLMKIIPGSTLSNVSLSLGAKNSEIVIDHSNKFMKSQINTPATSNVDTEKNFKPLKKLLGPMTNCVTNDFIQKLAPIGNGTNNIENGIVKIVLPNKVINKSRNLKRKSSQSFTLPTKNSLIELTRDSKTEEASQFNTQNTSRLITKAELLNIKVNRVVVNLSESEESSIDHSEEKYEDEQEKKNTTEEAGSVEYSDISSPKSSENQNHCYNLMCSVTPCKEPLDTISTKVVSSTYFEKKLDAFLKKARSKVNSLSAKCALQPNIQDLSENNSISSEGTPVVVRHLPQASQDEYKRLVKRMKMLERCKEIRVKNTIKDLRQMNFDKITTSQAAEKDENCSNLMKLITSISEAKQDSSEYVEELESLENNEKDKISDTTLFAESYDKSSKEHILLAEASEMITDPQSTIMLLKQPGVIYNSDIQLPNEIERPEKCPLELRQPISSLKGEIPHPDEMKFSEKDTTELEQRAGDANKDTSEFKSVLDANKATFAKSQFEAEINQVITESIVPSNITTDNLDALESAYQTIGYSMIKNLRQSLHMVEQAKSSKIARLSYEQRLKELYKEMDLVKHKIQMENKRISALQIKIRNSNKTIISLKQTHRRIHSTMKEVGKKLQGNAYRFDGDFSSDIKKNINKLTNEVRLVNSLKTLHDLSKLHSGSKTSEVTQENSTTERQNNQENKILILQTSASQMQLNNSSAYCKPNDANNKKTHKNESLLDNAIIESQCFQSTIEKLRKNDENGKRKEEPFSLAKYKNNCVNERIFQMSDHLQTHTIANVNGFLQCSNELLDTTVPCKVTTSETNTSVNTWTATIGEVPQKKVEYAAPIFKELKPAQNINKEMNFRLYRSPILYLKNSTSNINPNGLLCHYDLTGNCEDKDCPFEHITKIKG